MNIVNRILRILPCYAVAMFLYWQITPFLGNGPAWSSVVDSIVLPCNNGGWYKK